MRRTRERVYVCLLTLLIWLDDLTVAKQRHTCPIGFNLAYTKDETPICYRQKGPEAFADKFKDCVGNQYTSKLYHSLNLTKTNKVLWTEYKSLYPGGPFIDWSFTRSAGDILVTTYDVKYDTTLGIDEGLCVIIDPVSNFTATRCDEKHYRYCFVDPYPDPEHLSRNGCTGFRDSWRFYSPTANCLTAVTGVGGGTVRATWRQAQELCLKRGGSLLHRGWRYSNHPVLHTSGSYPMYPMGVVMNSDHNRLQYDAGDDTEEIADTDWHFETMMSPRDAVLGAVRDQFWYLVNSSYVFFDVICETPAPLRHISLTLNVDWEANIFLTVNDTIKKSDIHCFSDSLIYYPSPTGLSRTDSDLVYRVDPDRDGYYWCIQFDYKNFHASTSNSALFIRSTQSVQNLYACKIRLRKEYRFDNLDKLYKTWKKKLEEFIYYRTKYISVYGDMNTTDPFDAERVLKSFKSTQPDLNWKDSDVIFNLKIKRLYLDAKTALVHVMLNPEMQPLAPGVWDHVNVLFMKPAYFCRGFNSVPSLPLGESITSAGCRLYTCVGDFNEGVQWVETAAPNCTPLPIGVTQAYHLQDTMSTWVPANSTRVEQIKLAQNNDSSSSEESNSTFPPVQHEENRTTTEVTEIDTTPIPSTVIVPEVVTVPSSAEVVTVTTPPDVITVTTPPEAVEVTTAAPLPPEEKLDQLLEGLETLLQNESLTFDSITDTFDQVNDILDLHEDKLEIPGQLLHMLDQLGARIELNGEPTASAVRGNIALLMADVTPENPVRGVRVVARENDGISSDAFANDSFSFIDREVESDTLLANNTEALVYLPASVTRSARRVSFVAFRNQRAFPSGLAVNSRIFSVNVENLEQLDVGEVIDIHLTPLVEDPERNLSRACAYWQFDPQDTTNGNSNATAVGGSWATAGCVLPAYLEEYTHRIENELIRNDGRPIALQSMEDIVTGVDSLNPLIREILFYKMSPISSDGKRDLFGELWQALHRLVYFLDMNGRHTAVFTSGATALIVVNSTEDYMVRGYIMEYDNQCGDNVCCEAPGRDSFAFITTDGPSPDPSSNFVMFDPIPGKRIILIFFSNDSGHCSATAVVANPYFQHPANILEKCGDYCNGIAEQEFQQYLNESMQQVLDDLGVLLQNESVTISAEEVNQAFDQVDILLEEDNEIVIPGELLHMMDELGARVQLKGAGTGVTVRGNVALLVADSRPDNPVRGFRLAAGDGAFHDDAFEFITSGEPSLSSNDTNTMVFLPPTVTDSPRRISFVVFRNDRAFHHTNGCVVNSHVLSVNVDNFTSLAPGEMVDIFFSPFTTAIRRNESRACAYWHFVDNGTGYWSQDGCTFTRAAQKGAMDSCRCDHLTHFAQVVISKDVFSEAHEKAMEIISVIGCSFSLFGIIIVALTAIIFKSWRRNESNKIWLHLCVAVFILDLSFIVTVFAGLDQNDIGCVLTGVALHYSVLTTFCWMLVVSILSYRKLVIVFTRDIRWKLYIASVFSWGTPCLVIGILLVVDPNAYAREFEDKMPSGSFCYPSGLAIWLTVYSPVTVIWLVNWTLYALITKAMYNDKNIRRHSGAGENVRSASVSCLLAFLCGVPWVFGFFAYNIVAAYLFTLTVTFQGFVLFVFFVLRTAKTRNLWVNMFRTRFMGVTVPPISSFDSSDRRRTRRSESRFYVPKPSSGDEPSSELLSESRV